jgi:catechol 2,3-dioxygenase-like lactoylglutathione lyase family enzyme
MSLPRSATIIAFVGTNDIDRARSFYGQVLGLALAADEPFGLVFEVSGTMLRVTKVPQVAPASYNVLGWEVADIRAAARALAEKGIVFERFEGMAHDETGICQFPDGTKVAWFHDPDGNLLSITQFG